MKRIQEACICQTLHFILSDKFPHDLAVEQVRREVEHYKKGLVDSHTKFEILSESTQPDGSILIEIKKQYNSAPTGKYLG